MGYPVSRFIRSARFAILGFGILITECKESEEDWSDGVGGYRVAGYVS